MSIAPRGEPSHPRRRATHVAEYLAGYTSLPPVRILHTSARVSQRSAAGQDAPELLGTTIAQKYLVREVVGSGGMGTVYRAEQVALGRSVAIKVLHPHLSDEVSVARFYDEARLSSRLNHPNTVSIFDFGVTADSRPYIVMEYLGGRDLASVLATEGVPSLERACRIALGVLAALVQAHDLGILHRDLKPENLLLVRFRDRAEIVKVVDFGLALAKGGAEERARRTQPGVVLGTPAYMSPEQLAGDDLDERSDLYALGVVMFELLTGRLPFVAESPLELARMHLQVLPRDPGAVAPDRHIPPALGRVVLRALAKAPAQRYASALEMAAAIARAHETLVTRDSWRKVGRGVESDASALLTPATLTEALARLDLQQRQLLHAAAVLGVESSLHAVGAVAGGADPATLADLVEAGLVEEVTAHQVRLDASVRRLIEATIPLQARRELHDRALAWHAHHDSTLAIRVDHACRGSEPITALLLLEQLGDSGADGSDLALASRSYERGLALARAELGRTGDEVFDCAIAAFSRKLATSLWRQRRVVEAEGVLGEALAVPGLSATDRSLLGRVLADVRGAATRAAGTVRPWTLVVEDDDEIAGALRDALDAEGHGPVYLARHGKAAFELLARSRPPALILLDLMMPEMDGWDFLRLAREDGELGAVPIVIVSVAKEIPPGVPFVRKPVRLPELLAAVEGAKAVDAGS